MTQDEVDLIATRAAERALEGFFMRLGVDAREPIDMQQDFAFLRGLRTGMENAKRRGVIALLTGAIAAAAGWGANVFQHKL